MFSVQFSLPVHCIRQSIPNAAKLHTYLKFIPPYKGKPQPLIYANTERNHKKCTYIYNVHILINKQKVFAFLFAKYCT